MIRKLLQAAEKFEVEAYTKPSRIKDLRKTHVPFSGSPLKHPYDPEKILIVPDPFCGNTFYYEFTATDISFVEELPAIATWDGETVTMIRVWVKKKSIGIRCSPFMVEEIAA